MPQTGDHDAHHHSLLFDCLLGGVKERKGGGGPTAMAISGMMYLVRRNNRGKQPTPSFPSPARLVKSDGTLLRLELEQWQ